MHYEQFCRVQSTFYSRPFFTIVTVYTGTTMEQSQLEVTSTINITELLNESKAILDDEAEDRRFSVWVSCAEIYNEFIYDLLDYSSLEGQSKVKDKKKKLKRTVLKLAHDRNKNCYVKGLLIEYPQGTVT